jgi:anti-anti-sigma factor
VAATAEYLVTAMAEYLRIERLKSERGFRLTGAVDMYSVQSLRETLDAELHGSVVLDLAGVDYMNDDGLGLLVWAFKRLRQEGGSLVLRNPQADVRRALDMTGLSRVLTIEPALRNATD